jgi:hypothetical protein
MALECVSSVTSDYIGKVGGAKEQWSEGGDGKIKCEDSASYQRSKAGRRPVHHPEVINFWNREQKNPS